MQNSRVYTKPGLGHGPGHGPPRGLPYGYPMPHPKFWKNLVTGPGNKHLSPVKGQGMAALFFSRVGPRSFWQRYAYEFRLVQCSIIEIFKVSLVNKRDRPNMIPCGRDL